MVFLLLDDPMDPSGAQQMLMTLMFFIFSQKNRQGMSRMDAHSVGSLHCHERSC